MILNMKKIFDEYTIYEFSDEEIVHELCRKLKSVRRSCCYSQQDLSDLSGVSIASIKRIETASVKDINVGTIIKVMRATGMLDGFSRLLPDVPESPFMSGLSGNEVKKHCRKSYRSLNSHEK